MLVPDLKGNAFSFSYLGMMLAVGLSYVCMLSHFSHVQRVVTHWTVACQAPLSMGLSRHECWSELPCPPPGDLPNPGTEPTSPELQVVFFNTEPLGKPGLSHIALIMLRFLSSISTCQEFLS